MRRAVCALAIVACGRPATVDRERAAALYTAIDVDTGGDNGLSGLAVDGAGVVWAVAERGAVAFAITVGADGATAVRHAVIGVPPGEDLEAIAIDGDAVWIGTEGHDAGVARLFAATRTGDTLTISGPPVELTAGELGVVVGANHGAEGACAVGGRIYVAIETAGVDDGGRWAPIVAIDRDTGARTVTRLRLSSATGKLSALECWREGASVRALAVERHFETTRVLAFTLDGAAAVVPTVALDLAPVLRGAKNLEGIARLPDGRVVLVVDNQWRTVTGPNQLLLLHPGALD